MISKPTVALALSPTRYKWMFTEEDLERLADAARILGPIPAGDIGGVRRILKDAVVAISGWHTPFMGPSLLDAAPKLKLIAHSAGSVKGVVGEAVFDRGIRVTTAADANAVPVAHYTVAAMVSLLKQTPWLMTAMARGDQAEVKQRMRYLRELQDITIGLVGASRIGREVIKLLRHYPGVSIRLYDPYVSQDKARELGVELSSLEDVCRCPVVSIHAPRLPETHHMFNARTLKLIPDHGILINTSRGSLIDEVALVAEVRRRPLYVQLDVTDKEPLPPKSPLRKVPNILLTPHIAGSMNQARRQMGRIAIEETLRFLRGEPLHHEVTRQMLATQA